MKNNTVNNKGNMGEIAIIGMAGRFPEAATLSQFHENLRNGKDSVRPLDLERVQATSLSPGNKYNPVAYLDDIDKFDYGFFDIVANEAARMAPQQRIMLELTYELIEGAGYSLDSVKGSSTSVYMASNSLEYYRHAKEFDPTLLTGNLPSGIPGRVSRFFDLLGSSIHIDTACSSSLVALHLACQDILSGNSQMAVCGGVNVVLFPPTSQNGDQTGITSRHGKSKTFSDEAEGAGMGEGAACVLLKPLQHAIDDRDNILAVIKATATNQDASRSSTMASPSSIAQAEVVSLAIERSGIDPTTITYIEAHGTGTPLGDPIEVEGLKLAFEKYTPNKQFCAVSALKSNIGHTDAASGIAGVVKILLSIQNKELFPSLHVNRLNPHIDFLDSPLYVNTELRPWEVNDKRRAGVSAFGISGTNCHAIIEEWGVPVPSSSNEGPYLFCFSAKTKEALKRNCLAFQKYVTEHPSVPLDRISYTLNTGKGYFDYRTSIVAYSHEDLVKKLEKITISDGDTVSLADIWLLFAESKKVNNEFVETLCRMFPAYAEAYADCTSSLSHIPEEVLSDYAFGYSFYAFLKSLGLDINQVMGIGIGKDIVEAILKKLAHSEVATMLGSRKKGEYAVPKWEKFVEAKLKGKKSLIWEVGSGRAHSQELENYKITDGSFEITKPTEHSSVEDLLKFIGGLFEKGYPVKFEALYASKPVKVVLPAYQFEKRHCWIRTPGDDPVRSWIYEAQWKELLHDKSKVYSFTQDDVFVVYCSDQGIREEVSAKLRDNGRNVIKVSHGKGFTSHSDEDITFDWSDRSSYGMLIDSLNVPETGRAIHLFISGHDNNSDGSEEKLNKSLYPVLLLVQTLSDATSQHQLIAVTDTAVKTDGNEESINPYGASIHGFFAGVRVEFPGMDIRCIDIASSDNTYAESLCKEIGIKSDRLVIALRGGKRLGRVATREVVKEPLHIKPSGVYVLVGGGSGIGLEILKYFSLAQTTIVVIGRRKLPHKTFWPLMTKVSHPEQLETIGAFMEAEKNGASVHYFSADIANYDRVQEVVCKIKKQFGPVNGVVHAAGVGGQLRINRHTIDSFKETLLPKVHGTQNLYEQLDIKKLDFFILFSSLNAFMAAERESNYSAANAFLDSFAAKLNQEGVHAMTVRWSFWSETGMGFRMGFREQFGIKPEYSVTNKEGVDVFNHIMLQGHTDVLISKNDIEGFPLDALAKLSQHADDNRVQQERYKEADSTENMAQIDSFEDMLLEIWKKVLSRTEIDPNENFFQMGGHSLLGLQVRNQVEKKIHLKLEYKDIVEYPTINTLAGRLRELINKDGHQLGSGIPVAPQQSRYPLSEAQIGLWMADHAEQNKSVYNISLVYRLHSEVNKEALARAIEYMLERHEILRTAFFIEGEELFQSVMPVEGIESPLEYLETETNGKLEEVYDWVGNYAFDLSKAPLFRAWVVKTPKNESLLMISIHHIIIDGWSTHIFLSELIGSYFSFCKEERPVALPLTLHYKDYAVWEKEQLSIKGEDYKAFWKSYLKDFPGPLNFPTDFSRSEFRSGKGEVVQFELTSQHLQGFDTISNQQGVSKFLITLSMLQLLLYRYTAQEDFFVGTPMTLRNHNDLENQIGYYVNILPLRCKVAKKDTFYTLLYRSQELLKTIQEYQIYPFGRIIKDSDVKREPGRHFLFDIVFSYEHASDFEGTKDGKNPGIQALDFGTSNSKYDIELVIKESENDALGTIIYDPGLFTKETMTQLADHFIKLADIITLNISLDQFALEDNVAQSQAPEMRDLDFNF